MKNQIETLLLLGGLSAILLGFGGLLERQWVAGFTILALALNLGGSLVRRFSAHPPLDERIRRRRGMQLVRYAA